MLESKKLKRAFVLSLIGLLGVVLVAATATFAWYVFTVKSHTTDLKMAAGTNASLQISDAYDGTYSSSVQLERFAGFLNPVSTNCIPKGFQKVYGYVGADGTPSLLAKTFKKSLENDYYKTSLYFRTNGEKMNIYVADIGFTDSDEDYPISTAIRIGFVVSPTNVATDPSDAQYIFAINEAHNPEAQYNTATGNPGDVLDADRTDGTTVPFSPYTDKNWCVFNTSTGEVSKKTGSVPLCHVEGDNNQYGDPVQIDVYIWLEGCDEDCTNSLSTKSLEEIALRFAGFEE